MNEQGSTSRFQVLVWGVYFFDLIYTGLEEFPRFGREVYSRDFDFHPGGCFTTVLALNRLGVRTSWACDFGNDLFSQLVLDRARREAQVQPSHSHHHLRRKYPSGCRRLPRSSPAPRRRRGHGVLP